MNAIQNIWSRGPGVQSRSRYGTILPSLSFPPPSVPHPQHFSLPLPYTFENEGQGGFLYGLRGKLMELRKSVSSLGVLRSPHDRRICLHSKRAQVQDGSQRLLSWWAHFWSLTLGRASVKLLLKGKCVPHMWKCFSMREVVEDQCLFLKNKCPAFYSQCALGDRWSHVWSLWAFTIG